MLLFLPALVIAIRGVGYDGLADRNSCDFARALVTRDGCLVPGYPGTAARHLATVIALRDSNRRSARAASDDDRRCDSGGDGYAFVKISRGGAVVFDPGSHDNSRNRRSARRTQSWPFARTRDAFTPTGVAGGQLVARSCAGCLEHLRGWSESRVRRSIVSEAVRAGRRAFRPLPDERRNHGRNPAWSPRLREHSTSSY